MRTGAYPILGLLVLFGAAASSAQGQWVTTIKPTVNPLPIGSCHTVLFTVFDPKTKGTPVNPLGKYVSIADFDLNVEGPAIGKFESASVWSVCGCQFATVGAQGTITAMYPAKSLPEKSRVPDVAYKTQVTYAFAAAQSKYNPAGCDALSTAAVSSGGTTVSSRATVPPRVTVAPPAVAPSSPIASGATPVGASVGIVGGKVLSAAPASPPTPAPILTNPSGFKAVQTGPAQVKLSWQPVNGASYYVLLGPGVPGGGTKIQGALASSAVITQPAIEFTATSVPSGSQQWAVASYYEPGPISTPAADFPRATLNVVVVPINPSAFSAVQIAPGTVKLSWQPVTGAAYYVLRGPGFGVDGGVDVPAAVASASNINGPIAVSVTATNVPSGNQQWTVASYYEPNAVSTPPAVWPKVTLNVAPLVPINPSGFSAAQVGPGQVKLSWQPVSGVAYYAVKGPGFGVDGGIDIQVSGVGGANSSGSNAVTVTATDVPSGNQQWTVASYYEPNAVSTSPAVWPRVTLNVTTGPVPTNPSGFTAVEMVSGHVTLSWQSVSGAAYYIVRGPGLIGPENDGVKVGLSDVATPASSSSTSTTERIMVTTGTVPAGTQQWTVASYFFPGPVSTPPAAWSKVTLNVTLW